MNISPEQYKRFLHNQCSEEERLLFADYLREHPEALEEFLQAGDWEQFTEDMHLHPAFSEKMRQRFLRYVNTHKQQRKVLWRSLVAAVLLAAIGIPLFWLTQKPATPATIVAAKELPAADVWQTEANKSDSVQLLKLTDLSEVKLYAHSTLKYKKSFDSLGRDLYLEGIAHFVVAKDKHRPFTVYAGGIATTALGTVFLVTARPGQQKVSIALYEGKVKVQAVTAVAKGNDHSVYLLPGQELVMHTSGKQELNYLAAKDNNDKPVIKKNKPSGGDALTFDNLPLEEVIGRLQKKFNVSIQYDRKTISTIYITASFTDQDTLSDILNILCTLNNLHLGETGSGYMISR